MDPYTNKVKAKKCFWDDFELLKSFEKNDGVMNREPKKQPKQSNSAIKGPAGRRP